jgi:hypothetical protein
LLGTRRITGANSTSNLPFGTIDTPAQGATVSGIMTNFGWVLAKQPYAIPLDGTSIGVFIDGTYRGHPVYNNYRADIATLFPGYANSNGAVGYFQFDTRTLTEGLHSIAWVATDTGGNTTGLGSRYFTVNNSPISPTYTLSGRVFQSGGSTPIPGASLAITDGVNAGKTATSDSSGNYTFTGLRPGVFTVNVSAINYEYRGFGVTLTGNTNMNFTLVRSGLRTQFGPGQHIVNADIAPGRYFSDPVSGCYWERQSGLGGTLSEVIANEFIGFNAGQWIVDIAASDRAFQTDSECGTWFSTPRQGQSATITPGFWLVGSQVAPGTYRAFSQPGCYWERTRNFSGTLAAIIANDFLSNGGQTFVTISGGDVGFKTDGDCGTWTRVSNVTAASIVTSDSGSQSLQEIEHNRVMRRERIGRPR